MIEHFDRQIYAYLLLESYNQDGHVIQETLLTGEEDGIVGFWVFDPYTAKYMRTQEIVVTPPMASFGYSTEVILL